MSVLDLVGIACLLAAAAAVSWFGLRQRRRAAAPLRARNLAMLAALLGPRATPGRPPRSGRWHRVLRESHRSATLPGSRGVEVFSELVVADEHGRQWHCRLRCDDRGGADQPMVARLPASTFSPTLQP